jgi:integrase
MARPPLVLGTWGDIKRSKNTGGGWTAFARFRDYDGVTRQVKRVGPTGASAERVLLEALVARSHLPSEELTRDSTIAVLAEKWIEEYASTKNSDSTKQNYSDLIDRHIIPAMGSVRLREATVPYLDRFIKTHARQTGAASAKLCRVVLSHMFGLAARHGAVPANPVRDIARVASKREAVRGMSVDDVKILRKQLREYDAGTYKHGHQRETDLADVVDMLLATGVRTGEVLAITWSDIDLTITPPTVDIRGTVVYQKTRGYYIQDHPKTERSKRGLKLPPFATDMLERRKASSVTDLVFPSSRLSLRIPNNFRRQWRDFRDAYGYESWITPKTFRKAVATLIKDEGSIDMASDQLGHSGRKVTEQHYIEQSHIGPDATAILELFGT